MLVVKEITEEGQALEVAKVEDQVLEEVAAILEEEGEEEEVIVVAEEILEEGEETEVAEAAVTKIDLEHANVNKVP